RRADPRRVPLGRSEVARRVPPRRRPRRGRRRAQPPRARRRPLPVAERRGGARRLPRAPLASLAPPAMPDLDPSAYLVSEDRGLDAFDPADTGPFGSEDEARASMEEEAKRLARRQLILEANGTHGLLVIFQGMDASGKDEAIHHVMSVVDPQACSA